MISFFFFSSRRRHTSFSRDWSSDVCSSDLRRMSPRIVTGLLAWSGPQVAEALRAEDPAARTASVSWADTGPVPVWLDQVRELSEHWIHRQQLLQALDRPSDLRADLAGPV